MIKFIFIFISARCHLETRYNPKFFVKNDVGDPFRGFDNLDLFSRGQAGN